MAQSKAPLETKIGTKYTTSWANNDRLSWKLVDITNNRAYLQRTDGSIFSTHVHDLREFTKK